MEQASVNITMTVTQWNVVMAALGARPFAEVVEIINSIKTQAEAQLTAPAPEVSSEAA